MGAIAIHISRRGPADPDVATRMLSAAPHRGDRHRVEHSGTVCLAATNHSDWITATLARHGAAMTAFCGVLDNQDELLRELGTEANETPAATLLAAYRRWGVEAVGRLRGSFAGAIADDGRVWCFRDQFGTRPLFRHDGAHGFFAATEVKQVLAGANIPREPDLTHLHGILFGGIDRSTAYQGVERVPKAALAQAGARPGVHHRTYWDPSDLVETARIGPKEAAEATVGALAQAVRRQLSGSDALLLSGGLDSPSLAAFAGETAGLPEAVPALTAVYPNHPSADEREWTEMAANHVRMPLHTYTPAAGSMDDVETWVRVLDGPVAIVSIPECAEAYRAARELGARTVLNGEVAEFLFDARPFLLDHLLSHGRLRGVRQVIGWHRDRGRSLPSIARLVARAMIPGRVLAARRRRLAPSRAVPEWLLLQEQRQNGRSDQSPVYSMGPRRRWKAVQAAPVKGSGMGLEADEICAAVCGVDSRRPFVDVDLWETVLALPAEIKFPTARTKPLLREAMRGRLPDALIDRKDKTLFNEFHLDKADYPRLRRTLMDPRHRLEGVDYAGLGQRLEAEAMNPRELQWARDVARIHVFLDQW